MLIKSPILITEERPIERRGFKRATPFCEMQAGNRESLLSLLLSLGEFSDTDNNTFWKNDSHNTEMLNLMISLGHLIRQTDYKRKQSQ